MREFSSDCNEVQHTYELQLTSYVNGVAVHLFAADNVIKVVNLSLLLVLFEYPVLVVEYFFISDFLSFEIGEQTDTKTR